MAYKEEKNDNLKNGLNRIVSLDALKVFCTFLVVMMHTIDKNTNDFHFFFYCFGVFAIPLFFAIDGALLLNKQQISFKYCLLKILKTIALCLFWSLVSFLLFGIIKRDFSDWAIQIFGWFIQKGNCDIFWFFGSLIIIYCLLPLLHKLFLNKKATIITVCLLCFCCCAIYAISIYTSIKYNYVFETKIIQTFRLYEWLFYFFVGGLVFSNRMYFNNFKIRLCFKIMAIVIVLLLGTVYSFFFGKYIFANNSVEYQYQSPFIMLLITLLLGLIISLPFTNRVIVDIAKTNVGVYIFHYIFAYKVFFRICDLPVYKFFTPIIVYSFCLVISFLILKVKYLKKIISF